MAYEDDFKDVTDLYDKMKKLQKHQAFHGEIVANTDRISSIKEVMKMNSKLLYSWSIIMKGNFVVKWSQSDQWKERTWSIKNEIEEFVCWMLISFFFFKKDMQKLM